MKLIIDIDDELVETARLAVRLDMADDYAKSIANGIPLNKIKKQIDEQSAMHMDGELYIRNFDVKWILEGNEVRE